VGQKILSLSSSLERCYHYYYCYWLWQSIAAAADPTMMLILTRVYRKHFGLLISNFAHLSTELLS
jgi:hypothetical protein